MYKIATISALVVTTLADIYSIFLLTVGHGVSTIQEGSSVVSYGHSPSPAAIYPLIASFPIIFGLITRNYWVSWLGLLALSIFAGLFVFGIGGAFIPICVLLLVLLLIVQFTSR
ncbi:MAG TPA: hypothetical protein VIH14_06665 [Anaerolineales bacterium]